MHFTKLSIDGYGRFSRKELELTPGLQIIAGPNEQGKSTVRHFISDMLYGQKRSTTQRLYDPSNETRAPWNPENGYGGRLMYVLDSGKGNLFEVKRARTKRAQSKKLRKASANKKKQAEKKGRKLRKRKQPRRIV